MAKASSRCVRCVAVRNFQKVAHSGTASTAQNGEGREMAKAKVFRRCVRCVAVRKIRKWLTAPQRPQRRMERGARWRRQKSSGAVFVVSL